MLRPERRTWGSSREFGTVSYSNEPDRIWIWPWSKRPEPEGEVAVQIDRDGGLFVDPAKVAASETFKRQLSVMTELAEEGTQDP